VVAVLAACLSVATAPGASGVPSADAAAIAYTVTTGGVSSIWTMAPDGTNQVEVPGQPAASNSQPAASPDGTKIAFTSTPSGGTSDIWVMNVGGGGLTQLTTDPGNDSQPAWSSDGKTIAFQSDRSGNLDIWLMNPDGSNLFQLTHNSATDSQPAWFPGLRRVAFVSTRDGSADIWAVNGSGTRLTRVTTSSDPDTQPSVDPAGKLIAFTSRRGGNYDIYTVPVDGGTNTRVTTTSSMDTEPAFSTDSRYLTFTSDRSGTAQVWRMPRPSGTAVQMTSALDAAASSEWIPYTYPAPAWSARYTGTSTKSKIPTAEAESPDGSKVFVTGATVSPRGYGVGGFLIAYDTTSGNRLWTETFNGNSGYAASYAVAVSPDGTRVWVAGWADQFAHVAGYSTANGALVVHNDTVFGVSASAYGIVVNSNGAAFLSATGYTAAGVPTEGITYGVSATGQAFGISRLRGADPIESQIRLSSDEKSLYWIGFDYGVNYEASENNYVTVKYSTEIQNKVWSETYNGPGHGEDDPWGLALSPDGSKVYVTGYSYGGSTTGADQATVAYAAANGNRLWVNRFDSPNHGSDEGISVVVSPDGNTLYTAGDRSRGSGSNLTRDFLATSIDATDGSLNWSDFYNGPGDYTGKGFGDGAVRANLSPDGNTLFVSGTSLRTGTSFDMTTVGYDTSGNRVWLGRYDGPAGREDDLQDAVLSPDGSQLYVTGQSLGTYWDAATVAWNVPSCPCSPIARDADVESEAGGSVASGGSAGAGNSMKISDLLRSGLSRYMHPVRRL
jgi:TolB protein